MSGEAQRRPIVHGSVSLGAFSAARHDIAGHRPVDTDGSTAHVLRPIPARLDG